jgi:hypothetical protein
MAEIKDAGFSNPISKKPWLPLCSIFLGQFAMQWGWREAL